jgi:hypothetical protein
MQFILQKKILAQLKIIECNALSTPKYIRPASGSYRITKIILITLDPEWGLIKVTSQNLNDNNPGGVE